MKILAILLLLVVVLCGVHKVEFTLEVGHLNYSIVGFGYADIGRLGWVGGGSGLEIPFNGTFKNDTKGEYPVHGEAKIGKPLLSNLNKIRVTGVVDNPEKLKFEGTFKVHFFDLAKHKVPLKGKLEFSNNQKGDAVMHIDKSSF